MKHIYDVVDMDELRWLTANGYVREVFHQVEPLALLNYTDRAMSKPELFEQYPSLNQTRGLIYDLRHGNVVARPFPKFWNHGQPQAAQIPLNAEVEVIDKVDGSLGILYRRPYAGGYAIATRGSFHSEQAEHATELFQRKYAGHFTPLDQEDTILFEIIYPENRIVLDYGTKDDLILLGSVEIKTGYVNNPRVTRNFHGWPGESAQHFHYGTLAEALAAEPRPNAEGYVVRQRGTDRMVKLKQQDYLELHRIVFGLSTRSIWAALRAGKTQEQILEPLPDEFHGWVLDVVYELWSLGVAKRYRDLVEGYQNTMSYAFQSGLIGKDDEGDYDVPRSRRGALARLFQEADGDAWAMFALLDGKDIMDRLWRDAEPPAGQTPSTYEPGFGPKS